MIRDIDISKEQDYAERIYTILRLGNYQATLVRLHAVQVQTNP